MTRLFIFKFLGKKFRLVLLSFRFLKLFSLFWIFNNQNLSESFEINFFYPQKNQVDDIFL